jgi:hypothetical protein
MIKSVIKLISIISITLILVFSFVGQNLIINAGTPAPSTTTPKPVDTGTTKTPAPVAKSDGPAIGGLKSCTVDKNATFTPADGNQKLRDCLKDIISLVITIAVLISVASLVGYGIQLMNPMETSGKIQGQIAQRITELAVGGVILGMFGTILATINPATLTTSQIFGQNAVENFRRYIGIGQGATAAGVSKNNGTGPSVITSGGINDPVLTAILNGGKFDKSKFDKITDKTKLQALIDKNDKCTNIFADLSCDSHAPIDPKIIKDLEAVPFKSKYSEPKEIAGPVVIKYDTKITKDTKTDVYTATFDLDGKKQTKTFKLRGTGTAPCDEKSLDLNNVSTAGKNIVPKGCTLDFK